MPQGTFQYDTLLILSEYISLYLAFFLYIILKNQPSTKISFNLKIQCQNLKTNITTFPLLSLLQGNKGKTGVIIAAYMHYSKISAGWVCMQENPNDPILE